MQFRYHDYTMSYVLLFLISLIHFLKSISLTLFAAELLLQSYTPAGRAIEYHIVTYRYMILSHTVIYVHV